LQCWRYTYGYTWPVGDSGCSAAIHICIHVAIGRQWLQYRRYTYGYTWSFVDSGCSAGDTHMDTRGQWVTVAAVLAIHICKHVAIGRQWLQYCRYTYGYTWPVGDSGCNVGDTHMDTRGQWVTVAAVLAIHIWIHVASG
jgi:hypothetical protein